ncbi:MAG: thrombospondin type 3 repeat-containing protein [Deltaproteobacteria bacterium]|nr:thrombospondin type 3 repeat-containing protein [Deltaproteobacteria bacterium]
MRFERWHLRVLLTIGVLGSMIGSAYAACPLTAGGETLWAIDSLGNPDDPEVIATCDAGQANDCSLYGVIARVNTLLTTECTETELKAGTLRLHLTLPTFTITQPLALQPPPALKRLILDGLQSNGSDATIQIPKNMLLLTIECQTNGLNECAAVENMTDIEIRHLHLDGGSIGLALFLNKAKGGHFTLDHLIITGSTMGLVAKEIYVNGTLTMLESSIEGEFTGMLIQKSALGGTISNSSFTGPLAAIAVESATLNQFSITQSTLTSESVGFTLQPAGFVGKLSFADLTISSGEYGIFLQNPMGSGLTFSNVTLLGTDPAGVKAGLQIKHDSPMGNAATMEITGLKSEAFPIGIALLGNISKVAISNSTLSQGIYGIVTAAGSLAAPQGLTLTNTTFEQMAVAPVGYNTAAPAIYTDGTLNTGGPVPPANMGLDTPPSPAPAILLLRDWQKPGWLKVTLPKYFAGCTSMELWWSNGTSYYPVTLDTFSAEPCTNCGADYSRYVADTFLDAAHATTYAGEDLDALSVALAMTCPIPVGEASLPATSMVSAPMSLVSADWLGIEEIIVDTAEDDATKNDCIAKIADDCSLRGAIAYATQKRKAGKKHTIRILFADNAQALSLTKTLKITANNLKIRGPATVTKTHGFDNTAPDDLASDVLIWSTQPLVQFNALTLSGPPNNQTPTTLVVVDEMMHVFDQVTFRNASIALQAKKFVTVTVPTFKKISDKALVMKNAYPYVTKATVTDTVPTLVTVTPAPYATPELIDAVQFDFSQMTAKVYFKMNPTTFENKEIATLSPIVEAYVSFSKKAPITLESIGTFTPSQVTDADGNKLFFVTIAFPDSWSETLLTKWGTMKLSLLVHMEPYPPFKALISSTLSAPVTVIENLQSLDTDGDDVIDINDNAPTIPNTDQSDIDSDGVGDVADDDMDGDGLMNPLDNCPKSANAAQIDTDLDGSGDACDPDDDNDGVMDDGDNCPFNANTDQATYLPVDAGCVPDGDKDGVRDDADNCLGQSNPDQLDTDFDKIGDACDNDADGDNADDSADNCLLLSNAHQEDMDGDGLGDLCDPDLDGDGIANAGDNCSTTANANQADTDGNGLGDACTPLPKPVTGITPLQKSPNTGGCTLMP